jgi:hypothetical protein
MEKTHRPCDPKQLCLLPPSPSVRGVGTLEYYLTSSAWVRCALRPAGLRAPSQFPGPDFHPLVSRYPRHGLIVERSNGR